MESPKASDHSSKSPPQISEEANLVKEPNPKAIIL